jgi:hypothetical protein
VRVPALIVDFTQGQEYLGNPQRVEEDLAPAASERVFKGLMHSSDWLPTLLSYAQVPSVDLPDGLDGFDFSDTFRAVGRQPVASREMLKMRHVGPEFDLYDSVHDALGSEAESSPRTEMLLEMYYETDFIFGEQLQAFRLGDWKYINGAWLCVVLF